MSLRFTRNHTNRLVKRHVVTQLNEYRGGGEAFHGENNTNITSHVPGVGNEQFTPGYDHLKVGTSQYDPNPVP